MPTTYREALARWSALWILGWFATGLPVSAVQAADAPSRLDRYTAADGTTYFAASLRPQSKIAAAAGHDIVVLFDTSASQAGVFRDQALAALDEMLRQLGPTDRVRLIAVDLRAAPLHQGFVAPNSPEWKQAIARLRQRLPLAATDLQAAVSAVVESFVDASPRGRAAVYLGDGVSAAQLPTAAGVRQMVEALVAKRIPLTAYAVGPQVDSRLLAVLANHSGGNLAVESQMVWPQPEENISPDRARTENVRRARLVGQFLADSSRGGVAFITKENLPPAFTETFPRTIPPLRNDRDTILVGTGRFDGPIDLSATTIASDGTRSEQWTLKPGPSGDDNAYLAQLVELARADDGIGLPTVGSAGLLETRRMLNAGVHQLTDLAQHAVATGNAQGAQLFAAEAKRRDPGNPVARAILGTARKLPAQSSDRAQAGAGDLRLVAQPELADPADGALLDAALADGDFIDSVEHQNELATQMIQAEIETQLENARDRMSSDPQSVSNELKLALENVRRAPDIDPEARAQLIDRLESTLKETAARARKFEEEQRLAQEAIAAARERQRLVDRLTRDQQKVSQLMARMKSLVEEGQYREAEENVGAEAAAIEPDNPAIVAAILTARTARYHYNNNAIRVARSKAFIDTLEQVERSAIPFPDEPPIVYPDAPVWEELTNRRKKYASVDLKRKGGAEEKIRQALEDNTSFEFIETPLRDVVEYIKDLHDIEIQLDQKALDNVGIGSDTPVTRNLRGITLRSALRLLLRELDLTYVIRDEVLLITTPEEVENHLTTKVYPVADLVLPIPESGFQGGFGGLGGFGGNQGAGGGQGFGQGGGQGPNGGFGFGGGGGGGGQQGGGFFNVADEEPAAEPATRQTTELKLFRNSRPANNTVVKLDATPPVVSKKSQASSRVIPADANPQTYWEEFFARGPADPAAVRGAVRQLLAKSRLDHVTALCGAALRNGQPQPWMYETLGLAMEADGRPKEEIERVLMSSADFADNNDTLLYLAQYMARAGLESRALSVCRQVSTREPLRPEPYLLGLQLAERLDDLEALRWTTLGVLSQAWSGEQAVLRDKAQRMALATLEKLKQEKRPGAYRQFKEQLAQVAARDCVVRVSWTGRADIDLLVEEPSGTICSWRNPRTTAGGVMLGDATSRFDETSTGSDQETYVCPQGFSGDYRVLLRRAWGKVTAGKVTVDIITHYGSKDQKHERQQIVLGDKDQLAIFHLDNGRRQEPVAEQQLENAAARQVAIGRAVLAQQLADVSDPRIEQEIARRRGTLTPNQLGAAGGGAVGFQPVIITLPEGTNFAVTGVISADRRYVRITALPIFSGIGEVTTFTFAGASQSVDGGGANAGGGANNGNNGNNGNINN